MAHYTLIVISLSLLVSLSGCTTPQAPVSQGKGNQSQLLEDMTRANRLAADHSQAQIEGYLRRHHDSSFSAQANGLYTKIWGTASQAKVQTQNTVKVAYRLELLDGTLLRDLDSAHAETLLLGRRDRTAGLDLLLLMMRPGQQGEALVPAELGYGLQGDGAHVPPNSCLHYTVKWFSLQ